MNNVYKFSCGCQFPILDNSKLVAEIPLLRWDIENTPANCQATWRLLAQGLNKGVFQLEKPLGRQWLKKLKPQSLSDMSALGALLRPGCLQAKDAEGISVTEHFCRRKNNEEPVTYFHEALKPILSRTYGLMVYQEDAIAIAKAIAGFNPEEADLLRRAIGKKDTKKMAQVRTLFAAGCEKVGQVTSKEAEQLFDWIEKGQRYSFNLCISGDEVIRRPTKDKHSGKNNPFTIKEMYLIRNNLDYAKQTGHEVLRRKWMRIKSYGRGLSMCEDSRIRPNEIIDIQPAGTRPAFRITLENNLTIEATANHKFPTSTGIKPLSDLTTDDYLYICGEYQKGNGKKYGYSNQNIEALRNKTTEHDHQTVGFMSGGKNPGYTNGSYTEFMENQAIIPMVCQRCGAAPPTRLELHHKNGDRTNSSIDNLERLCASCHKKSEYANGRVKRGEKGYPTELVKIVSITYVGNKEVFDVTMAEPNHNFVTSNNIITCNSHSYRYGMNGYFCAYYKAHFPSHFYAVWLSQTRSKPNTQQEIDELVTEAKLFDIEVTPPSFLSFKRKFHLDGKNIRYGFSDIKGCGDAAITKLWRIVEKAELELQCKVADMTWLQFLTYVAAELGESLTGKLIRAGCLHFLPLSRTRMLEELRIFESLTANEQQVLRTKFLQCNDLRAALLLVSKPKKEGGGAAKVARTDFILSQVKLLEKPPTAYEDSVRWIVSQEQELLGTALTASLLEEIDPINTNCTCKEWLSGRAGTVLMAVELTRVAEIKVKNGLNAGQPMAFLSVKDQSASLDCCVVFSQEYAEYKPYLTEGNIVAIQGERDRAGQSLLVKKILKLL